MSIPHPRSCNRSASTSRQFALAITLLMMIAPALAEQPADWSEHSATLRATMRDILTIPDEKIDLDAHTHRTFTGDGYVIESITYASEPHSRVTALLYLPAQRRDKLPAVIVACGHGGSKSALYAQYAGQLYAKLGFACLVPDTIGEEERQKDGKMGARGHDLYHLKDNNPEFIRTTLKRMVLGKIVWDLIRGIDYLQARPEVDEDRIGIVGYSLGGASAGSTAILDSRVRTAVICGWAFRARYGEYSKYCTRMPYAAFTEVMGYDEMTALLAPHCPTLFMVGEQDEIIDADEGGAATKRDLEANIAGARKILTANDIDTPIEAFFEPDADHRPYFLSHRAAEWLQRWLITSPHDRVAVPDRSIRFGQWVDAQGQRIERLYNTEKRERGLAVVDINAIYHDPKTLACFPDDARPEPVYTMAGWVDAIAKTSTPDAPPPHR